MSALFTENTITRYIFFHIAIPFPAVAAEEIVRMLGGIRRGETVVINVVIF